MALSQQDYFSLNIASCTRHGFVLAVKVTARGILFMDAARSSRKGSRWPEIDIKDNHKHRFKKMKYRN